MPLLNWVACGSLSTASTVYRIISTPNGYIYILGNDSYPYGYVWKSIDNGTSFSAQSLASIAYRAYDITYKSDDILFVSYSGKSPVGCSAGKTINQGTTWTDLTNAAATTPQAIFYDTENSTLYMGEINSTSHIFKSINDGSTWTTDHTFATANANANQFVKYGSYIYCSTEIGKIFRTLIGSGSWSQLSALSNVSATYTVYVSDDIILAGGLSTSSISTVWKSTNGGSSWTQISVGSDTANPVREIIKVGNYYVLCKNNQGVFISLDAESWIDMNLSGSGSDINAIGLSGTNLYVNRGTTIYRADATELFIPVVPSNIICTPGTLKNTLTFTETSDATSYNLYLTKVKTKNEYFVDDSRFSKLESNGTVTVSAGKMRIDIADGLDGYASAKFSETLTFDYNNSYVVDISNYTPDDTTNGFNLEFRFTDGGWDFSTSVDGFTMYARQTGAATYSIYGQSRLNSSASSLASASLSYLPSSLRVRSVNETLIMEYMSNIGEWTLLHTRDFGTRISNVTTAIFNAFDQSLRGGYVDFDNFTIEPSVKDFLGDSLTETFEDLDNWSTVIKGVGETATIVTGGVVLDIPDSVDGEVRIHNNDDLPLGSYEYEIDILSYTPDSTTNGLESGIRLLDSSATSWGSTTDGLRIYFKQAGISTFNINADSKVDEVLITETTQYTTSFPTKFKVLQSNNIFYMYYYHGSTWYLLGSRDFSSRADLVVQNIIIAYDSSLRGGSIKYDNLTITSPGTCTQITGIISSPYDHITIDGDEYIYNLTSVNAYGESLESDEVYGSPTTLSYPTNVSAVAGLEQVTITGDAVIGADSYNIYWKTSSGVTVLDNKIEGVTFPYLHTSLGDYTYHYIVTSISGVTESSPSSEVSADPWYGPPAGPTNFEIDTDTLLDSECVLQWDTMLWTDSYNLYCLSQEELDALSGVKKTTVSYNTVMTYGTKFENVTSPYNHYPLTAQNYYYCIVGVNTSGEGIPEGVLIIKIKYDGKIFDHSSAMFRILAQQYRLD